MVQNGQKLLQIGPTLIQKCFKNGNKWSKNYPNMVQKRSHISICDGVISSLSAVHHQFLISSSSVHHQFIISSSSVHSQFTVSSFSVYHQFMVKLGTNNITHIGLRAEGAKANALCVYPHNQSFQKFLKVKATYLLNFDPILKILLLAGQKLSKDSGKYSHQIFVKNVVLVGKKPVEGVCQT